MLSHLGICWKFASDSVLKKFRSQSSFIDAHFSPPEGWHMANTINVNLATLKRGFHDGLDAGLHTLDSCVPEISINPEILAAIRAGEFGSVDGIVGPSELEPAPLTAK
jgi:hypothetical protein